MTTQLAAGRIGADGSALQDRPAGRTVAIVLSYNKKYDLLDCLRSLEQAEPGPLAVVVVDNASSDGAAEAVAENFPQVHLVALADNVGAPAGRNIGARFADQQGGYDTLLFLDDDVIIEPDCLGRLQQALRSDPEAAIAGGKTFTRPGSSTIMSAGISVNLYSGVIKDRSAGRPDRGRYDMAERIDALGGFGLLIRRDVFEDLGGFDERFTPYGWDDVDLCLRARRLGQVCRYEPSAIAYHKGTRVGRAPIPSYERVKIRNYLRMLASHASRLQLLTCAFLVPIRACLLIGRFLLTGHARTAVAQLRGALDVFTRSS